MRGVVIKMCLKEEIQVVTQEKAIERQVSRRFPQTAGCRFQS